MASLLKEQVRALESLALSQLTHKNPEIAKLKLCGVLLNAISENRKILNTLTVPIHVTISIFESPVISEDLRKEVLLLVYFTLTNFQKIRKLEMFRQLETVAHKLIVESNERYHSQQ